MKKSRFLLIPLLFICGVLLLSLLLRWIGSHYLEKPPPDFQTQVAAPAYAQWQLPEGATLRLGKGHIRDIKFVPDGTQFVVVTSIGIWLYDAHTGVEIARLNEKARNIKTVAFSPDGKTLTSSDYTGDIQTWDIPTAKLRATFRGPERITNAVAAVSTDGITLANERNKQIRLWKFRPNTTEPIITDTKSDSKLGYRVVIALSPDAKRLAAAAPVAHEIYYPIWVWDANTGELLSTLTEHTRWIETLAFSSDSKTLASGDAGNTIRLWNVDTGTYRGAFKISKTGFHALAFSPNGKFLASGGSDGKIRLWDATVKKQEGLQYTPLLTLKGHKNRVSALAFSPDGKTLITASRYGNTRVWDTTTGSERFTCSGHFGNPLGLVFSETGSTFTSVYPLTWNSVQLKDWDVNTGNRISVRFLNIDNAFAAISPEGKTIVAHDYWERNITQLSDVNAKRVCATLKGPPKEKRRVAGASSFQAGFTFSPDSTTVASGGKDNVVRLWDATARQPSGIKKFFGFADTRHPQLTIQGHPVHVRTLAFSPDGKMLAGGSNLGAVHLWDAHTGTKLFTLKEHSSKIRALAFSPDGKTLASGSANGKIILWDTENGKQNSTNIAEPRVTVSQLLFSLDGKILVSGDGNGILQLWDVHTRRLLSSHAGHTDLIQMLLLSPDGKTLASGSTDGTILLWNWEEFKKVNDK